MQYCVVRLLDSLFALSCTIILWIFFLGVRWTLLAISSCWFFFMNCGDHFPCWCLTELCVGLCFRVHLLSFYWWACPCQLYPSPLFSLMGEACNFTYLLILRIFVLNKEFFSNYFGQCLEWFHRLHIWLLHLFGPCFYIPVCFLTLVPRGSLLIFRSGLAGLGRRGSFVCWHV